jgi:hypothetical protein
MNQKGSGHLDISLVLGTGLVQLQCTELFKAPMIPSFVNSLGVILLYLYPGLAN